VGRCSISILDRQLFRWFRLNRLPRHTPTSEHLTTERPTSHARATIYILLGAFCFGAIAIFVVLARRAGAPLTSILAWRFFLAALFLTVAAGGIRALRIPRGLALRVLLLGGGGQALVSFLALRALDYLTAATNGFLFYTYPAWVTVFAFVRGTERIERRHLLALTLSFAGIATMVGSPWSTTVPLIGILLSLSAAVCYGFYIPTIGALQEGMRPTVISVYIVLGAGIAQLVIGGVTGTLTLDLAMTAWMSIVAFALIGTTLAFLFFLRGLRVLGAVRTAIVSTIEPFFTAMLGALVLAQPLPRATLAGGGLIAVAVILLQLNPAVARQVPEEQ
jgi:drug/metabolite transporter (DMT)-like permease